MNRWFSLLLQGIPPDSESCLAVASTASCSGVRVYLATGATGMHKSTDGLSILSADRIELDSFYGYLLCFCNWIELAIEKVVQTVLMPVAARKQRLGQSDDMATMVMSSFILTNSHNAFC